MKAKQAYLEGDYSTAGAQKNDLKTMGYKIGGLVFTGQHEEARLLYKSFYEKAPPEAQTIADFHMGLSFTRTSEYQAGRHYFVKNLLKTRSQNLPPVARFFAFQGVSFYRFFFSCHQKSQFFAQQGYQCLLEMDEPPSLLLGLSLDIQAHNKIQLGEVGQGLKLFQKALDITKNSKLTDLHSEIEISHLLYQSEHDVKVEHHVKVLKEYLEESENKNDYSKSEIVLQISKLYMLMGKLQDSHDFLSDHFDIIYRNQNKRKIAILNTLMAQLMLYKGQYLESLSVINVALSHLNPNVDRSLYLPLVGLKIRSLKALGKPCEKEAQLSEQVLSHIDRKLNINIQNRAIGKIQDNKRGDDTLADHFNKIERRAKGALQEILQNNTLILLYKLYDLDFAKKYILVCEAQNTVVLIGDREITNTKKSLTKLQIQILSLISEGASSKEQIIEKIWGYSYDPLRHDSLVYTAIGRIRKILEPYSHWVYSDENHYRLDPNVTIKVTGLQKPIEPQQQSARPTPMGSLNYRQLQIISEGSASPLSVSQYGKKWEVTRMTALRDLKELVEKNLASKVGRGKATRYIVHS